jgi:phosphatidylglycerophosphatase A
MRTRASSPGPSSLSTPGLGLAFAKHPLSTFVATGLGSGLAPVAPGTVGSAVALFLAWLLSRAIAPPHAVSLAAGVGLLASGLVIGMIGVPVSTRVARVLGARDPGSIVIDEFAGQFLACAPLPLFLFESAAARSVSWLASFLLFRLFDIWKPGPVNRLQKLPEGWGIVADDVAAGLAAAGATAAVAAWLSRA